jgi:hypothetical protein
MNRRTYCDIICYRHSNKYTFLFFNQKSTICVQIFNDSQNLTIHIIYRILPRSYSIKKPRYPLLKVVLSILFLFVKIVKNKVDLYRFIVFLESKKKKKRNVSNS